MFYLCTFKFSTVKDMEAAVKTQSSGTAKRQDTQTTSGSEPKRLSKVGQWMLDNPGGIFIVKDRRAVNR